MFLYGCVVKINSKQVTNNEQTHNENVYFYHNNTSNSDNEGYYIVSDNVVNLLQNQYIYMDIEKYNSCDEIIPFKNNQNDNNNGLVNSFFAKIPINYHIKKNDLKINQSFYKNNDYISYYQPPIEKISKLKFKFRYHNGILVDFKNQNIFFSLEINLIRNELTNYNVRLPFK